MKAEDHLQKGQRLEEAQQQLDVTTAVELMIEGCYMAAHHFIEAGAEWLGFHIPKATRTRTTSGYSDKQKRRRLSSMPGMIWMYSDLAASMENNLIERLAHKHGQI